MHSQASGLSMDRESNDVFCVTEVKEWPVGLVCTRKNADK